MKRIVCFLLVTLIALASLAEPSQRAGHPKTSSTQAITLGYTPAAGSGLTLSLSSGTAYCNGAVRIYAGGTLTMKASATNYVYLASPSNCAPAVKTSAFAEPQIPIAIVVTGKSAITTVTDVRATFIGGGISGAGACASNQFVTAVNSDTGLTCVQPSFSGLSGSAAVAQLPAATTASQGVLELAGDLAGTSAAPTVSRLQGYPVSAAAPAINQVLQWNGTQWAAATLSAGSGSGAGACPVNEFVSAVNTGAAPTCIQPAFSTLSGTVAASQLPAAGSTTEGMVQLAGDLGGTASAPNVTGLEGIPLSATPPTSGQVYQYNSSTGQWTPATVDPGVASVGLSAPAEFTVSGSPVTSSGMLTLTKASESANTFYAGPTSGTAAAPAFRALTSADLPTATTSAPGSVQLAGDLAGSASAPEVTGIEGNPVSTAPPAPNQVLSWNGSAWAPATPASSGGTTFAGDLSGSSSSQTVVGLQGWAVASTAPSTNQILTWNGSAWAPATSSGSMSGSGTTGSIAEWTGSSGLGNSPVIDASGTLASTEPFTAPSVTTTGTGAPTVQLGASGPSWTSGTGAPTSACVTGSLYSRLDGGAGSTLYACEGPSGSWAAK